MRVSCSAKMPGTPASSRVKAVASGFAWIKPISSLSWLGCEPVRELPDPVHVGEQPYFPRENVVGLGQPRLSSGRRLPLKERPGVRVLRDGGSWRARSRCPAAVSGACTLGGASSAGGGIR